MEILKNKKVLIGGILALVVLGYFYMAKKKKDLLLASSDNATNGASSIDATTTSTIKDNYTVTLGSVDPTGAVFLVLGGKKYAFVDELAFKNYGYIAPEVITKANLDLIPIGGFVDTQGKIVKTS